MLAALVIVPAVSTMSSTNTTFLSVTSPIICMDATSFAFSRDLLHNTRGTRGVEDAAHYLEYCNFPGGTEYSDLRKMHGVDKPYGIKLWCLGNEMDGSWQVGHKSAEEYGKLAAETGKVMKIIDPEIELIVCGSSLSSMETYPEWDMEVLDKAYDIADYLALHQYYAGQEKGTPGFLAYLG